LRPASATSAIFSKNVVLARSSAALAANISRPLAAISTKPPSVTGSASRASAGSGSAAPTPHTRSSSSTRLPSSRAMPTMCTTSSAGNAYGCSAIQASGAGASIAAP
jgi:hypothetical protein